MHILDSELKETIESDTTFLPYLSMTQFPTILLYEQQE
jgi:hypothetical protein